jgi:hypothetical protein
LHHPDYFSDHIGATLRGRALEPLAFDGRKLGALFSILRPPLKVLTLFGMMASADDVAHLLRAHTSIRSFGHVARLCSRYAADRLHYPRGARLLMGNALCGRLLYALNQLNVDIWTEAPATGLLRDGARVTGAAVRHHGQTVTLQARRAVILATGGFAHSKRLQDILLPKPIARHSAAPDEITGDGIEMGLAEGARLEDSDARGAFWSPLSLWQKQDGTAAFYPHFFLDRGKPGFIAVNKNARRFVNEATSYDAFVRAMYAADATGQSIPCYLIAESRALKKYGMGLVLPGGRRLRSLLKDGYLKRAFTIPELAKKLALDPGVLIDTITQFNSHARRGHDPEFHRGETEANLVLGDPAHNPHPCLGPLEHPPFYPLELHPGINGTSTGLAVDEHACVLGPNNTPITGLYCCGNDMSSIMSGTYPGPGVTIGPAIVFAYIAIKAINASTA